MDNIDNIDMKAMEELIELQRELKDGGSFLCPVCGIWSKHTDLIYERVDIDTPTIVLAPMCNSCHKKRNKSPVDFIESGGSIPSHPIIRDPATEGVALRYWASPASPLTHPQEQMKLLGITYESCDSFPISDQWHFYKCKNLPNPLPDYLEIFIPIGSCI